MGDTVYDQNAYGNIEGMLKSVGVTVHNSTDYNTKFGIKINAPLIREISGSDVSYLKTDNHGNVQTSEFDLLRTLYEDFRVEPGEADMLIFDIPDDSYIPPQSNVVMIADSMQSETIITGELYGTVGVCRFSPTLADMEEIASSPDKSSIILENGESIQVTTGWVGGVSLYPGSSAIQIIPEAPDEPDVQYAAVEGPVHILLQPRHGTLGPKISARDIKYLPERGYIGNDRAEFLVEIGDQKIKVIYFIKVQEITASESNRW